MAGQQTRGRHSGRADTSSGGAATKADHRERVREGRARDREYEDAYNAGKRGDEPPRDDRLTPYYEDGRRDAKKERRSARTTKAKGRAKSSAKRRARTTGRKVLRDAKKITPTAAAQVTSGLGLAGMTLGLVGLYLVLTNVPTFQGVLGAVARAVSWLGDPDASIPYRNGAPS